MFGFCESTGRLVDVHALLDAAKAHSIPGLGVCTSREQLLQSLKENPRVSPHATEQGRDLVLGAEESDLVLLIPRLCAS